MIKISKKQSSYIMSKKNAPVAKVQPGAIVEFETYDCFKNQIISEEQTFDDINWDYLNPGTGPIYIEGAEVGDVLKVHIEKIELDDTGVICALASRMFDNIKSETKIVSINDETKTIKFSDKIDIKIKPMVGVIGVAPAEGEVGCVVQGSHGGNMDNKKIKEGSTVYLPVFVKGGLLSLGDLHAAQGDGEVMTGVEVSGKIITRIDVIKTRTIKNPMLYSDDTWYTIASHEDLFEAVKIATHEMLEIVMDKFDMSYNEAGMFLSAVGDTEICQVVDPLFTARFGISKEYLENAF
jgi:amidase